MGSRGPGDSGDLGTERYVRVGFDVGPDGAVVWRQMLSEGEEGEPGAAAREASMRRHPAGRALTGLFTQSHPWLAPAEPAEPIERRRDPAERVEALEARVAELAERMAILEGQGDVIEARTCDGQTRAVRTRPESW